MRPQDIAILLKVISIGGEAWQISGLATTLFISLSEVSESLNRSKIAGLIDHNKKKVHRQNLMEFLEYGVKYVFPQEAGAIVRGTPTAHSHPFMKRMFASDIDYVWPNKNGSTLGLLLEPFYAKQVDAAQQDELLYKLLALVDVIRVGRIREIKYAVEELKKLVL